MSKARNLSSLAQNVTSGGGLSSSAIQGGTGITLYDEDTLLGTYTALNFVGATVTAATQSTGKASVTVTAAAGGASSAKAVGFSLVFGG
jgi:hypothetical protein